MYVFLTLVKRPVDVFVYYLYTLVKGPVDAFTYFGQGTSRCFCKLWSRDHLYVFGGLVKGPVELHTQVQDHSKKLW